MRNSKSSPKSTNKKDILINESAGKEMIHTYCFQTRGDDIKKIATIFLRQLLLRAGDVEMNPGPKYRSIGPLQERELLSLAHDVSPEYYNTLCIALGFTHARSKTILTKNLLDVCASVFEILCMWKTEQTKGSDCRRALVEILRGEDLNLLANKISEGIYNKLTERYTPSPTTFEIPTMEYREQDSDRLLKTVAKQIHKAVDIDSLGVELGFEHSEIQRYIQANRIDHTVTYMGTLNMLRDWRKNTKRSEEREKLKKALIAIRHQRLADDLMNDDVARINETSLGGTVPTSPRLSPSTSVAIPFQDTSAAAGDVFTARVSETVSDGKLNTLAAHFPQDKYHDLSDKLGIEYNEASRILMQHGSNYNEAMRECLAIWKNKSGCSFIDLKRSFDIVHVDGVWMQYMK